MPLRWQIPISISTGRDGRLMRRWSSLYLSTIDLLHSTESSCIKSVPVLVLHVCDECEIMLVFLLHSSDPVHNVHIPLATLCVGLLGGLLRLNLVRCSLDRDEERSSHSTDSDDHFSLSPNMNQRVYSGSSSGFLLPPEYARVFHVDITRTRDAATDSRLQERFVVDRWNGTEEVSSIYWPL